MKRTKNWSALLAILIVTLSLVTAQMEKAIRCPLVWIDLANGDPIPSTAVQGDADSIYIIRAITSPSPSPSFIIGSYDTSAPTPEGYFPSEDLETNGTSSTKFQLLSNPYACVLEWKPFRNGHVPPAFTTQIDTSPSTSAYIGRGIDKDYDSRFFAGNIISSLSGILIAFGNDSPPTILGTYDVLTSYTIGLTLEMSDFTFDTDPFAGSEDFLGSDVVINNSSSTIRQTLTHKKLITEVHTITTSKTWTSVYTQTFKVRLIFFSITRTKVTTYERTKTETVETTETTEVAVSRDVTVPPFTSVQACSVVSIKESAEVPYTARVKYSAPGLLPIEVKAILESDEIDNAVIDGDNVVVVASGMFSAKLAMNTEFYVKQVDAGDNCDVMKYKIDRKNKIGKSN